MSGGELFIRAAFADGRILLRETRLSRPPLTRLLTGMGETEALTTIPALYSLCREAQTAAATAALARAKGEAPPPTGKLVTDRLWGEMLHERLWRLCLDWPRVFDCSVAQIDTARQAFATWRASHYQRIPSPAASGIGNDIAVCKISPLPLAGSCRRQLGPGERANHIENVIEATRQMLLLLADILPSDSAVLLDEAADILRAWREGRFYPFFSTTIKPNHGRSVIFTARGWLQHEVMLAEDGKIVSYAIHAPTDRNFADGSRLAARIANSSPPGLADAKTVLERAVLLLDPCVPWEIVWED